MLLHGQGAQSELSLVRKHLLMEVAVCAQIQICNDRLKHLTKQAAALQYNQFIGSQQFGSQEYRVEDLPDV